MYSLSSARDLVKLPAPLHKVRFSISITSMADGISICAQFLAYAKKGTPITATAVRRLQKQPLTWFSVTREMLATLVCNGFPKEFAKVVSTSRGRELECNQNRKPGICRTVSEEGETASRVAGGKSTSI